MKKRAPVKRTAVARPKRAPDTHIEPDAVLTAVSPTVYVVMGHRGGSHGVVGLYASRAGAEQEVDALTTKGNKHARSYTFTIDERVIQP